MMTDSSIHTLRRNDFFYHRGRGYLIALLGHVKWVSTQFGQGARCQAAHEVLQGARRMMLTGPLPNCCALPILQNRHMTLLSAEHILAIGRISAARHAIIHTASAAQPQTQNTRCA